MKLQKVDSTPSLIGFYHGNIKGVLRVLREIPEEKRNEQVTFSINHLSKVLETADESWELIKELKNF